VSVHRWSTKVLRALHNVAVVRTAMFAAYFVLRMGLIQTPMDRVLCATRIEVVTPKQLGGRCIVALMLCVTSVMFVSIKVPKAVRVADHFPGPQPRSFLDRHD